MGILRDWVLVAALIALPATSLAGNDATSASSGSDYTPNRTKLPFDKSVTVKRDWDDSVRFLFNRGEGKVHFQTEVLDLLDPKNIRATPGYKGPGSTLITLMAYEVRSREVVERVGELLDSGFNVRIVADSGTFTLAEMPSEKERATWSERQNDYFRRAFDFDHDGEITQKDLDKFNEGKQLSNGIWQRITELSKKYPKRLDLAPTPYEMVPAKDGNLYPRLTHLKLVSIAIKQASGAWRPEKMMVTSANLTDSCLDCRISQSKVNKERYLKGEKYAYAKGSQGHAQFGAIITGGEVIQALLGPTEEWISLYKDGKHFDDAKLRERQLPRVVFERGAYRTTLQAFYSEGTKAAERAPEDLVWAITNIIGKPENELKVYYDAQFVFTHKNMARHLRHQLNRGTLEAFNVFVDGNFAVQSYSALPDLLFAHKIDNMLGVSAESAVQRFDAIPNQMEWQKHVFVYDGTTGVYGGPGDKLHSKVTYFEYIDGSKARHYVVVWGSGNKSSNAGQLNADALYVLDSTDPSVGQKVRPYFDALREDPRMLPYPRAYLAERLYEMIKPDATIFEEPKFLERFQAVLDAHEGKAGLKPILESLKKAGAVNAYGANFLALLDWFVERAPSEAAFGWADLHLSLLLANPNTIPQPGLVEAVSRLWGANGIEKTVDGMIRGDDVRRMKVASEVMEIMNQCEAVLTRLRFPRPKPVK
jgi:hypothetical protein